MTDIISELEKDLHLREQSFAASLKGLGNSNMAVAFEDMNTIRRTIGIYQNKPSVTALSPKPPVVPTVAKNNSDGIFPLRIVTKAIIKELGNQEFTIGTIFDILQDRYPNNMTQDKKPSVSATLSNLGNAGELEKLGLNEERKMKFKATTKLLQSE